MSYLLDNAVIVQSDRTILLEVHSPKAEAVRKAIATLTLAFSTQQRHNVLIETHIFPVSLLSQTTMQRFRHPQE